MSLQDSRMTGGGVGRQVTLGGATDSSGNPAGNVIIKQSAGSIQFIPKIAGTSTSEIQIDAVGTDQVVGARAVVNGGTAVAAATALMNSYPDCLLIDIGESVQIYTTDVITSLVIIGLGTADNSGAYAAPVASTLLPTNVTVANYITTAVTFDFLSIDEVRIVEITLLAYSDGTTDKNLAQFKVVGYSS